MQPAQDRILLGVNIDHVATVRQARRSTLYPEPVQAALVAEQAGADGITLHLREDRRHIIDRDVELLAQVIQTRMNLEMAVTEEMISLAERIRPAHVCFVPEKREEITTEGGLDVISQRKIISAACRRLSAVGCEVSFFIDASSEQIEASKECGADAIEIHTGCYADAKTPGEQQAELSRIQRAVSEGLSAGLSVNAGHGLDYHNVHPIAAIIGITELNIGYAIVARAIFTGLHTAVKEMRLLLDQVRVTT